MKSGRDLNQRHAQGATELKTTRQTWTAMQVAKNVLLKEIIVANLKSAEKMSHPLNTALPSHEGQTQPAITHHPSQASTHPLAPPVHTQTETESPLCASTRCTAHHPPRQHLHRNRSDLREPESPCNYHTEPASGHNTRHPA